MGNFLIGLFIGALLFIGVPATQTEEVIVEKEVPVEIIVEKEVIKEVPVVPAEIGKKYTPGAYKVGRDIPAGEYKCEKIRGKGHDDWVIIHIATDANFNNTVRYDICHETALFSCSNGDYIKIEYANFYLIN